MGWEELSEALSCTTKCLERQRWGAGHLFPRDISPVSRGSTAESCWEEQRFLSPPLLIISLLVPCSRERLTSPRTSMLALLSCQCQEGKAEPRCLLARSRTLGPNAQCLCRKTHNATNITELSPLWKLEAGLGKAPGCLPGSSRVRWVQHMLSLPSHKAIFLLQL